MTAAQQEALDTEFGYGAVVTVREIDREGYVLIRVAPAGNASLEIGAQYGSIAPDGTVKVSR